MKIEVTIEGQEPTIHKLVKAKTLLGAGDDCDVKVVAQGISRKHLLIIAEDDQYFVIDQGSTNGTFLNEERLVPGERTSFTSFFPLKLGGQVSLALLSDEDGSESFDFAKELGQKTETRTIEAKTQTDVVNPLATRAPSRARAQSSSPRGPKAVKSPKTPGSAEQSSSTLKIMAFVIAIGGSALFFLTRESEVTEEAVPAQETVVEAPKPPDLKMVQMRFVAPLGTQEASNAFTEMKCTQGADLSGCSAMKLPLPEMTQTGVVSTVGGLVFVLPQLNGAEITDQFSQQFDWSEDLQKKAIAIKDPRDLIALYLARLPVNFWTELPEDKRWLYVMFSSPANTMEGPIWVADLTGFRALAQKQDQLQTLIRQVQTNVQSAGLAGMFRKLVAPAAPSSESL